MAGTQAIAAWGTYTMSVTVQDPSGCAIYPAYVAHVQAGPDVEVTWMDKQHWMPYACPGWGQRYDITVYNPTDGDVDLEWTIPGPEAGGEA